MSLSPYRSIAPFDFMTEDSSLVSGQEWFMPLIQRRPLIDLVEENGIQDDEEEDVDMIVQEAGRNRRSSKRTVVLPPPPAFQPLPRTVLEAYVNTHEVFSLGSASPAAIFRLFFNDSILQTIVTNTNSYAIMKNAGSVGLAWTGITLRDLIVWIALTMYQGLHQVGTTRALWNKSPSGPIHKISALMTATRYEQIKRFVHVSAPDAPVKNYFDKVEPLLSHIRDTSKRLYTPATNVSVDEMVVRFTDRSMHTDRTKNKPIPEGYKIFSLCESGYTFTFLPSSRVAPPPATSLSGFSCTESIVYHLVTQLPAQRPYNIFMNNYFSSVKLFQRLRDEGYGACGTVRSTGGFPKELQVYKSAKLDWDTRSGVVVGGVLAVLWQDDGPVSMLTTIHGMEGDTWEVSRERSRPRETSTNAAKVRAVFGNSPTKTLTIPKVVDEYNHIMGGVDIADQLKSYHNIQQPTRRNWMPLFFWLLETAIVNSYLISSRKGSLLSHDDFRDRLIWELVDSVGALNKQLHKGWKGEDESDEKDSIPQVRVTKNFRLPIERFSSGLHPAEVRDSRSTCRWCSWKVFNGKMSVRSTPKSQVWCAACEVPLCLNSTRNCYRDYHTVKEL